MSAGILVCTLSCPWPDRPAQGLYNQRLVEALGDIGVPAWLFSPAPPVPRVLRVLPSLASHASRPTNYSAGGAQVLAPRVPFAFPRPVRNGVGPFSPERVARWMERAVGPALDRAIAELRPEALLAHGVLPWGRTILAAGERHRVHVRFIEHSFPDLVRADDDSERAEEFRLAAETCDAFLTVSEPMRAALAPLVPGVRVEVIENGADTAADVAPRPAELDGQTVVLSAANYYPRKRFEALVRTFRDIRSRRDSTQLVLITDAPPSLRRLVDASEGVRLLPTASPTELAQWMAWADLFALPSVEESFGIVYAEAMRNETPVVMSSDCGLAPTLSLAEGPGAGWQHDGWVVPAGDDAALAQVLREALANPARLATIGRATAERARARFDWRVTAARTAEACGLDVASAGLHAA